MSTNFQLEHRAYIIEQYFCSSSYARTIKEFQRKFSHRNPPDKSTVERIVDIF